MAMPPYLRPSNSLRLLAASIAAVFLVGAVLIGAPSPVLAQAGGNTGRIVGIIQDSSGQPVPFANVIISGVGGVIAGDNGRFQFDNLPAGTYDVTIRHISVEDKTIEGVIVTAGKITNLEHITTTEAIAERMEGIKVTEKRREKLATQSSQVVRIVDTKEQSKIRAINTTEEAIATQAGVVQLGDNLFVRGGRSSEVKTVVDGMPVSDAFTGSTGTGTMDISIASQEGINMLTGGMDAEYGNAQSGVIEVSTREGGEEYEGQLKFITDDFGAPDKTYFNYDNISFGFGGPVPFLGDNFRFFGSGEGVFQDTYLKTLEQRPARTLTFNGTDLAKFRDRQNNALRGQMKVTYRLPGAKKISGEYLFSRTENDWYHHSFSRVGYWSEAEQHWWFEPLDSTYTYYNGPAHLSERRSKNEQYKMVYTHPLTSDSYVKVRFALFRNFYKEDVGDKSPEQYVPFFGNDTERDPENLFFAVTGDFPYWERRESNQYTIRSDYQNRVGDSDGDAQHELKTGFTMDLYDLQRDQRNYPSEDNPLGNSPNQYDERAFGGVAYVQDRLRYKKSMVMNAGLRFDFFDPGANAIRISNLRVLALQKPTEGTSFLERFKAQVSPRLGMSYPISDKDVLHFHYGRFFQLPDLQYLYDYSNNANAGNNLVGNAFLEPETTISYQFGVRRQLSDRVYMDATVFFKDIFGLVGTEPLEAENEQEDNPFASTAYVNKDYGSVRGFELAIDKNFSNYWQGGIAYTLSRASGSSSDVNQGSVVQNEGLDREPIKEVPLDWDRTHVISAYLYFSDPGVWGLNFDLAVSSGPPTTPRRLGQRTVQAEDINTIRLPSTMTLSIRGNKQYALYGQEFRLFLEGRNLLDRKNVQQESPSVWPTPSNNYYQEYYTEFGELGGAYNLADTIGASEDVLIPLNDPRVYGEPRLFRVGLQFEF
jgi:outer membrane receptor protein involved in Fe transport